MRRTSPTPLPTARMVNGVLTFGADPWFDCASCGAKFDTAEHAACPACVAAVEAAEAAHSGQPFTVH